MLKKYFTYVPLWISIIANIILGGLASGPFLIGFIFLHGLFANPSIQEQLIGLCIILGIFVIIISVNYLIYYICKKKYLKIGSLDSKKYIIRLLIIFLILIFFTLSYFWIPDLWSTLNGWWF